jgi:hypothetical protein
MNKRPLLLLVLSLAMASGMAAPQLYKSVGPDGKVTFSDKPPADPKAKISVLKSSVMTPLESTVVPPFPTPSSLAGPKSSAPADGAAPYSSAVELDQAVLVVMGLVEITRKVEPICTSIAPLTAKRLAAAIKGWNMRNATFIQQQQRILMEVMTPAKRASLQAKTTSKTEQSVVEVSSLGTEGRVKWCERVIANLSSEDNDIANVPAVSVPLITNKPR